MLGIIMCAAVLAIIREQFFWFALGVVIGSACHELGHMLCAAIVSIPIHSIVVGSGPLLWRGRFGESWFELRLLPFSGFVAAFPPMKCRRYRWALFLLGGVLGNVTVVCLLAGLDASGFAPERAGETLGPVVLVQLFLIIVNLLPLRAKVGGTLRQSDGMQLLQLSWGSLDPAAQLRTAYATILSKYNNGNSQPKMNSDSWRILYNMNRFQLAIDEHSRREYRQALLRELESGDLVCEEKMFVLDGLVTDGLISGDPAVRDHLDEWSLHALALGPKLATLLASRGAVLVELGRFEAGKALLEPLAAAYEGGDSLMSRAFLARAERALGNPDQARRLASAARGTLNASEATPRITAMLSRLEAET